MDSSGESDFSPEATGHGQQSKSADRDLFRDANRQGDGQEKRDDAIRQRIEELMHRIMDVTDAPICQEALDRVQYYGLDVRAGDKTYFDPDQHTIFIEEGLSPKASVAAYAVGAAQATYWYEEMSTLYSL